MIVCNLALDEKTKVASILLHECDYDHSLGYLYPIEYVADILDQGWTVEFASTLEERAQQWGTSVSHYIRHPMECGKIL